MRFPLLALTITIPLSAIVIDSNVAGFSTGTSVFTGVTAIHFTPSGGGTSLCSGALIAVDLILTAGHCVSGASNWQVKFETPTTSQATVFGVSQSYLHPGYTARPSPMAHTSQYDIAILRLSTNAPSDATIYGIKRDFAGVDATSGQNPTWLDIVGYGLYGFPGATPTLNFSNPERHWARNTYDFVASSISGASTPDLPIQMSANFSTAAADEGLVNGGDSGGPMLYGNYILGVASLSNLPRSTAVDGNTTYSTFHANLAEDVTGEWVESFVVPEPGTVVLAAAGLLALLLRRRMVS